MKILWIILHLFSLLIILSYAHRDAVDLGCTTSFIESVTKLIGENAVIENHKNPSVKNKKLKRNNLIGRVLFIFIFDVTTRQKYNIYEHNNVRTQILVITYIT